jgi:uncharacterized membrane protein
MQTQSETQASIAKAVDNTAVIAVYNSHEEAEKAIRELQQSGFDMQKLSIVGKDYHTEEDVVGYYNTGDRMKSWGKMGAFWGGLWGMLFGSAVFLVPGVGAMLAAGPLVAWIVGALEGAVVVGGVSALGAALFSIGIPKNSIIEYETQLKAGKFVVIAHGSPEEVRIGKDTLAMTQHQGVEQHSFTPTPAGSAA